VKVLVIPEDQTHDSFIIKPVVEAILADLGRRRVDALPEPRLRGSADALDAALISSIVDSNPMVDLFVLAVDRDCNREGNESRASARVAEHPGKLIACVAHQEVEVWMLALHIDAVGAPFAEIRANCDPKEPYAEPLLDRLGSRGGPGAGRKAAMRKLAGNVRSLMSRCAELAQLSSDIETWWQQRRQCPPKGRRQHPSRLGTSLPCCDAPPQCM
jgi:hypothetical protein